MRLYEELKKDLHSGSLMTILQLLREYSLLEHFLPFLSELDFQKLWEPGKLFLDGILRIDTLQRDRTEGTATAILSFFTLFYTYPDFTVAAFIEERMTQQRSKDLLDEVFESLAVPRKEKERISLLIRDTQQSLRAKTGTAKKRRKSSARNSMQAEKAELLYYLGLEEMPEGRPANDSRRRERSRSESRGKRRGPNKRNPRN